MLCLVVLKYEAKKKSRRAHSILVFSRGTAHRNKTHTASFPFRFDVAFTSVLQRAIKTLFHIQDALDAHWIPVNRHWRLNERMYGALQGLNKAETAAKHGEKQVAELEILLYFDVFQNNVYFMTVFAILGEDLASRVRHSTAEDGQVEPHVSRQRPQIQRPETGRDSADRMSQGKGRKLKVPSKLCIFFLVSPLFSRHFSWPLLGYGGTLPTLLARRDCPDGETGSEGHHCRSWKFFEVRCRFWTCSCVIDVVVVIVAYERFLQHSYFPYPLDLPEL